MRIVFMGSPDFAVPSLNALNERYDVVLAVTQPDRIAGRGRKLRRPAVKQLALEHAIPVFQPERIREQAAVEEIRHAAPDLIVVAAFGQILPQALLEIPPHGCLNVHASLLPRWRGAAPIQAAIAAGDRETGVTIMRMDAGLDTGPILLQRPTPIAATETGGELSDRLSILGAQALLEAIPPFVEGMLAPKPQDEDKATYAPLLKKADGRLDFTKGAEQLARQIRAFEPWPGSFFLWREKRIAVRRALPVASSAGEKPGGISIHDGFPLVGTSNGGLLLEVVQPAGRKPMSGDAFLRGSPDFIGAQLGIDDH